MSDSKGDSEARVDAAIAEFLQAIETDPATSMLEFLHRHADIADELREFFADHAAMQGVAAGMTGSFSRLRSSRLSNSEKLPRQFGEFELLSVIGRGGMGTVYAARRDSVDSMCAIKVLHPWLLLEPTSRHRFAREAETTLRLQHPNIVPTLGSGCVDDVPYLEMKLIDGQSLDQLLKTRCKISDTVTMESTGTTALAELRSLLSQFAEVADALQRAHDSGVLHRDIKPSNLMLTTDGQLLIGDFGLARWIEQPHLTQTGDAVGSPAYMSPEQLASNDAGIEVDHRTDVYSLGATLYEVLTGRPPFVADSRERLLASIRCDEPHSIVGLNPLVPRDWETVVFKAISKLPQDRFNTAAEFAAELRRCVTGLRPVTKHVGRLRQQVRSFKRQFIARRKVVLIVSTVGLVLLIAVGFWHQSTREEQRQQSFDAALIIALTGDLKATEAAIERAQAVPVSQTDLALLRGQVAYHRGEYDKAVEHLEASSADRHRVAAFALQASAHLAAGDWEDYERLLEQAETLPAVSAEDFLFRGQAEIYLDPDRAAVSLDEAVRRRDTPLARLVRAESRWNRAFDRSDLKLARAAISDAFIARDLLPDHPAAIIESLHANHVAMILSSEQSVADATLKTAADETFAALQRFQHLPSVVHNQALYLIETGSNDAAYELLQQAKQHHQDGLIANDLALALWQRKQPAAALKVLQQRTENLTSNEEFLMVALLHELGDSAAARLQYERIAERYQTGLTAYFRPCLLLVMGDANGAKSESRRLCKTLKPLRLRGDFYSKLLAYNAGEISESDLLRDVESSRWDRCESLFFAGLQHRARGDRINAKRCFEQCVATRCVGFLAWNWSHALLKRDAATIE